MEEEIWDRRQTPLQKNMQRMWEALWRPFRNILSAKNKEDIFERNIRRCNRKETGLLLQFKSLLVGQDCTAFYMKGLIDVLLAQMDKVGTICSRRKKATTSFCKRNGFY